MNNKVQCLECNKYLHYINHLHLKSCCDLTIKQYKEKYPNAEFAGKEYVKKLSKKQEGIISPNKGNKYTHETRKKISDGNKNKKYTKESCKKISDSLKGRKFTEQHCKNMKIAAKKAFKNGNRIAPNKGKKIIRYYKTKIKSI